MNQGTKTLTNSTAYYFFDQGKSTLVSVFAGVEMREKQQDPQSGDIRKIKSLMNTECVNVQMQARYQS